MHVAICWDISATGARWNAINEKLKAEIKSYSWVRPLGTLYVVKVTSTEDRDSLVDRLTAIVKNLPEKVHFVVTPTMSGGRYNGWLPKDLWDKINERTEQ